MKSEINQTLSKFPHEIKTIPIADIVTGNNPRRIDPKSADIRELANNIKATGGVLQPIIVRALGARYELLAGGRRIAASKLAGFTDIKAAVYDVGDEDARLITVTENLHREGLTPLEEAQALRTLINTGKKPEDIAAELGRPLSFVLRRARLLSLTPEWLAALSGKEPPKHIKALLGKEVGNDQFDADDFKDWPVAAMEMIARYDAVMQNYILARLCYTWTRRATESVQNLERFLAELSHQIKKAPWAISDASLLPKAGACDTCPKRSSHNPGLFEDDLTPEKVTASDKCLDIQCWESKMKAHAERRVAKLQADYPNLVKITEGWNNQPGVLVRNKYSIVKKSDKGAVPAVIVDGESRGKLQWININGQASKAAHPKGKDGKPVAASKEERYKKLADRRNAFIVSAVIEALGKTPLKRLLEDDQNRVTRSKTPQVESHRILLQDALAMVTIFGTQNRNNSFYNFDGAKNETVWTAYEKLRGKSPEEIVDAVWQEIRPVLAARLNFDRGETATLKMEEAEKCADLICLDMAKIRKSAEEAIPVPKSWAKLDEEEKPKPEKKPTAEKPKKAAKSKPESSGKAKPKKVKRGSLLKKK